LIARKHARHRGRNIGNNECKIIFAPFLGTFAGAELFDVAKNGGAFKPARRANRARGLFEIFRVQFHWRKARVFREAQAASLHSSAACVISQAFSEIGCDNAQCVFYLTAIAGKAWVVAVAPEEVDRALRARW
jgi:hypothetical protein